MLCSAKKKDAKRIDRMASAIVSSTVAAEIAAADAESDMHEDCQDVAAAAQRFVGHSLCTTNGHGTVGAPE